MATPIHFPSATNTTDTSSQPIKKEFSPANPPTPSDWPQMDDDQRDETLCMLLVDLLGKYAREEPIKLALLFNLLNSHYHVCSLELNFK